MKKQQDKLVESLLLDQIRMQNVISHLEDRISLLESSLLNEIAQSRDLIPNEWEVLYKKAKQVVIDEQNGSVAYLQRRMNLGFTVASKLQVMLEERGIIGPANGSEPRWVKKI